MARMTIPIILDPEYKFCLVLFSVFGYTFQIRKKARSMINVNIGLLMPMLAATPDSRFTVNKPITKRAIERIMMCFKIPLFESPFFFLISIAKGIDIPRIKRNEGKTMSEKPSMSSLAAACSSQWGTLLTLHRSFTKIIKNIVKALYISIDAIRLGFSVGTEVIE